MSAQPSADHAAEIAAGYTFNEAAVEIGVLTDGDTCHPEAGVRIPASMLNRHGVVAGATGTGKTRTLQVMAEQISSLGVPVFATDIKGDLTGLALSGDSSERLLERTNRIGQEWVGRGFPVEFYALGGEGVGVPLRATVTAFGPLLLSKVLELNDVQESSLGLVFHYADSHGLPLLDLADLRAVLQHLTSDEGKAELRDIGGVSTATVGVILRKLVTLESQGGDQFFGEPEFDTADLRRVTDGTGVLSLLELPDLAMRPALFSTFVMWLLADMFSELPEVGDQEKPALVFFFDEAHLLFKDASKAFLESIVQTVRLIRSKGVGIFFVTQNPADLPDDVLAQLGSRVQHQLRAHTPRDAKALKQTVQTFPTSAYGDLGAVLQELGTGEAIVTVMDPDGAPTPVARTMVRAPQASMDAVAAEKLQPGVQASPMFAKYGEAIDRESAHEILTRKVERGAEAAAAEESGERDRPVGGPTSRGAGDGGTRPAKPLKGRATSEESMIEKVAGSSVFKQFARSAGREIVRSLFGTARRR